MVALNEMVALSSSEDTKVLHIKHKIKTLTAVHLVGRAEAGPLLSQKAHLGLFQYLTGGKQEPPSILHCYPCMWHGQWR